MDTSPQTALAHKENAHMSTFSWIQDRKTEPSNRNQANQRSLSSGLETPNTHATQYPYIPVIVIDQVDNIILHSETETQKSASPPPCPADIVTRYPHNRTTIPHASSWHHGGGKKKRCSVAPAREHPSPNDRWHEVQTPQRLPLSQKR